MTEAKCYVQTYGTRTAIVAPHQNGQLWYITMIDEGYMQIDCKYNLDDAIYRGRTFMNEKINAHRKQS